MTRRRPKSFPKAGSEIHTLIVGGTKGIGRVTAKLLAQRNHRVSIIGRNPLKISDLDLPKVSFWKADLFDTKSLYKTLEKIMTAQGNLRNIAFFQRFRGVGENWQAELDISLSRTKEIIEFCAGSFLSGKDNSIVITGSPAAKFIAEEQTLGYHVVKAGLLQLTRYFALFLGPSGVRVNCVTPAVFVKEESKQFYEGNKGLSELFSRIIPLGRMGTSLDIARVIAFLFSPMASYITGQNIVVDGGISIQNHASLATKVSSIFQITARK